MEKIKKIYAKHEGRLIWLILILAAGLRFWQIDSRDFWYDEAFTGIAVKEKFHDMMVMIVNDVHPPLYYWTVKIFASFFNYSVFGIRLFSAIFGVFAVWAVYLFARELFDRRTALWAALIAAISPFAIQYSQEARMYVMLVFFILIAAYFFVRGLKTGKTKYFLWWGFFTALAALTHYMGIIFAVVYYPVYVAWHIISEKIYEQKLSWKMAAEFLPSRQILAGYAVAFLIFFPWVPTFLHHLLNQGNNLEWVVPASLGDIFWNIQMFIFGTPKGEMSSGMANPNEFWGVANNTAVGIITIFFVAITFYLYKKRKDKEKITAILMLSIGFLFVVYILSLLGKRFFVARYLMPGAYFLFVYLGLWLANVRLRTAMYALVIYVTLMLSFQPYYYSQGWNLLQKDLPKYEGDHFYILNSFDYVIGKYYLGAGRLTLYNIDWPQYDPSYWAAIGPTLKKTEDINDIRNDPKALIIFNGQPNLKRRDDADFDPTKFTNVAQYKNIGLYRFGR
ncbi:MAG: glycosyltransferase family 39 protein [Candidatus Moranbacteria bacterium]|nr:glycosyltransferase family 39 protein [Candidatus Moranbacteria bacterium]